MVETPPCLKPRSSSSTRLLLRLCVLTTLPLTWVCTRCKTPASESTLSSATVELKRLGTTDVTLSVTTQGRAMMGETAFDWGPATTGRDKMEFVTWSATVYIMTTMMEIVVTQRSLTFSRPALIVSPLTGELNRQKLGVIHLFSLFCKLRGQGWFIFSWLLVFPTKDVGIISAFKNPLLVNL